MVPVTFSRLFFIVVGSTRHYRRFPWRQRESTIVRMVRVANGRLGIIALARHPSI